MKVNEKLQTYLDGELSAEETRAFQSALETDSELRTAYENAQVARKISAGLLELDMRERLRAESLSGKRFWMWGVAAALLIAVLGFFLFRSMLPGEQANYAMEYSDPLWPGTRGGDDELARALQDFRSGEEIQVAKLKVMSLEDVPENMRAYWVAEMFLARNELDSAAYYLPEFTEQSVKYERVLWISKFIEQKKSSEE